LLTAAALSSPALTRGWVRVLAAEFDGAAGKDSVSRVWWEMKSIWDAWHARPLAEEPIIRLIQNGTVVRLDRKAN
jgi:putative transposase